MPASLILKHPDPRLREHCDEVTHEEWEHNVPRWCSTLRDTMLANSALGLAAPQVGIKKRIFAVSSRELDNPGLFQQETQGGILFFVNPILRLATDLDSKSVEACLSVPGVVYPVKRSSMVDIRYLTPEMKEVAVQVSGEDAVILQHEFDHLNGKLFVDLLSPVYRKEFLKRFEKPKREKTAGEISQLREQKRAKSRKNRKK